MIFSCHSRAKTREPRAANKRGGVGRGGALRRRGAAEAPADKVPRDLVLLRVFELVLGLFQAVLDLADGFLGRAGDLVAIPRLSAGAGGLVAIGGEVVPNQNADGEVAVAWGQTVIEEGGFLRGSNARRGRTVTRRGVRPSGV